MLVNFRFKNYRSFYQETNLSMEAVKDSDFKDINTFSINEKLMQKGNNNLLKSAMIFGGNASGKTNLIKALAYMKRVVLFSSSQIPVTKENEPFAFYIDSNEQESLYEIEIIQNNIYYKYGFTLCKGKITSEWLEKRKERLSIVFKRNKDNLEITGLDKRAVNIINLSDNILFLSFGNSLKLEITPSLNDVMMWFHNLLIVFENDVNSLDIYSMEHGKYQDMALKILQLADIGIKNIQVQKDKITNVTNIEDVLKFNTQIQIQPKANRGQIKQEKKDLYNIDMKTDFEVFDNLKKSIGTKSIMLYKDEEFNSEGTIRLISYLGWILAALDKGRVIFIDEIDSKLHFLVTDYLVKLFNSIDKNPNNAQLVCTAHNVMLMDEDLRRDQIYFTSKDCYGESFLVALSDYKNVRKTDLFSKKYLAGFYSKLPDMNKDN